MVLAGDYNVIPTEADARRPEAWKGDALFLAGTRAKFRQLLSLGLTDAVRFIGYRRDLDLDTAVCTTQFTSNGVTYRREVFASYPGKTIVIRLTASRPARTKHRRKGEASMRLIRVALSLILVASLAGVAYVAQKVESSGTKMTHAADKFLEADRGRLLPGFAADLVVFDPATVANRATEADPAARPVGIGRVMVNGEWAVIDGRTTGRRAGRSL